MMAIVYFLHSRAMGRLVPQIQVVYFLQSRAMGRLVPLHLYIQVGNQVCDHL